MKTRDASQANAEEKAPDPRVIMRREGRTLVYFTIASGAAFGLLVGARAALGLPPHAIDDRILVAFRTPGDLSRPIGPAWLEEMARDATTLAGWPVLTLLTVILAGYLATRRRWETIALVVVAVVGQSLIVETLKGFFERQRPGVVPHLVDVSSYSFPSGHSASAAAFYLVLGAALARNADHGAQRAYIVLVAIAMTLIMGFCRIYLGVHYPSDVLAGLAIGAAWASIVWLAAYYVQHRK